VYGPGLDGFKEDSKCLPQTPYAWSKFLIDKNLKDIGIEDNFAMTVQSFRYFNVYGPGEGHKGDQMSLVSKFQKQASQDGVIKLFENSDTFERDCICVYDLCLIHDLMMKSDANGIFNVGTGRARNLREIAEVIAKQYDATIEEIPMPAHLKGQYQTFTQADLTELKKVIKLPEFIKIEDYIRDPIV
jgi:ADP-L-glycero-D-manno-heptose 6-epimerase